MECLPMWVGLEGVRFSFQESVESLWAFCYRSDVKWSLRGRCELHNAVRGERRAAVGPSLCPNGAFSGDESFEVLGGNRVL